MGDTGHDNDHGGDSPEADARHTRRYLLFAVLFAIAVLSFAAISITVVVLAP